FAHDDLRSKLAGGVQEARDSIIHGRDQVAQAQRYVDEARSAYSLAKKRMLERFSQPTVYDEVRLSIEAVGTARVGYLNAIRHYNIAQLRLLILRGAPSPSHPSIDASCPNPVASQR